MEISALTNLITAFRAETRQDSITPETLGSRLQRIVNILSGATDSGGFQLVEDAVNFISGCGNVLVGLSLGADDRGNIYVIVDRKNISTGVGTGQQLIIRPATTERAGAMKAQQVAKEEEAEDIQPAPEEVSVIKEEAAPNELHQWASLKVKHPDAVLLFRHGSFYEAYGADAEKAATALNLTLTPWGNTSYKMCGFPFHALDPYLPRLIRAGHRVAICDQLEMK